jgi:hypothetical protein
MPPAQDLTADRPLAPAVAVPGALRRHGAALGVLLLTALSFALPSAPTYDPWSWLVWGREIIHLDLNTVNGPSWKPLPMLVTPVLALAGGLAPDLWLFVARAAAIASVVVVFRLVRRLDGGAVGATAAAAAYAVAGWTIRNGLMGNSEGLLVACALGAAERHLAGHRRQSFLLLLAAGLLRPEVWPFLGLYGLWLAWRMPAARALVAAGFASLPALWLLPEWWGSGDPLRAMTRAQEPVPGTPGSSASPVAAVLERFSAMLTPSIWAGLAALVVMLLLVLGRRRAGPAGAPHVREARAALLLLGCAVALVAEVALMSAKGGFTGGTRYLILPAALVVALAGVGAGWAVRAALGGRAPGRGVALGLVAVGAVAFAGPSLAGVVSTSRAVFDKARVTDDLGSAVRHAGGRARLLACGAPYTGPFEVPSVAWQLHTHTGQVALKPRRPAVIFATPADPARTEVAGGGRPRTLAVTAHWHILGVCRPGGGAR